jgi:hypothetical protein
MHSAFQKLLRKSNRLFVPLISVAFLNLSSKKIFNADEQSASTIVSGLNESLTPKNLQQTQTGNWNWDRIIQIDSP